MLFSSHDGTGTDGQSAVMATASTDRCDLLLHNPTHLGTASMGGPREHFSAL